MSESIQLQRWLRGSACAAITLCGSTFAVLALRDISGLPAFYFYSQDAILLLVAAAALLCAPACLKLRWQPALTLTSPQVATLIGLSGCFAYVGANLILLRYPMSNDEALAQFAGQHLARGELGWPIPKGLQDLSRALLPVRASRWSAAGFWTAGTLPVSSAFRAIAILLGDAWLAGPLLLSIGLTALWASARRIWPDNREPAIVVLLLALTSSQLLITAMSAYAMTAHFALNALWILCFLRGGRVGHGLAILVGVFATGLHQLHFHMMFISGFVVWLWLAGQRRTAVCYVAACIAYIVVWQIGFSGHLLPHMFNVPSASPADRHLATEPFVTRLLRLRELEPFSSFARFAAWQNILLLPLAFLGLVPIRRYLRRGGEKPPIALALQLSCALGLTLMPYQGFGYGYRYLHGMLPCFLLLAGQGWLKIAAMRRTPAPSALLLASLIFSLCVTLPFTAWRSHQLLEPYAASFRAARAAPADIVVVDGRGAGFLQDIVRIDQRIDRPMLLDLAYIPRSTLARICRTNRVMLFDGRQAHALGVFGTGTTTGTDPADVRMYPLISAQRRRDLARWHCDTPIPLAVSPR